MSASSVTPAPPKPKSSWLKRTPKFIAALSGLGAEAISEGLVSGTGGKWVAIGFGVLTAAAVFLVPNSD